MTRERVSVLTADEVEALTTAFDRTPAPQALQHSSRLKTLVKSGSYAVAMLFLSFGEMTQRDTQIVQPFEQAQGEPTWLMLQRLPLTNAADRPWSWPATDLTLPPLALTSTAVAMIPLNARPLLQTATIRRGDNPSSGDVSRQAVASSVPSKQNGTGTTPGLSIPPIKTASNNPLKTLIGNFFSGFKPSSQSQTKDAMNKAPQPPTRSGTLRDAGDAFGAARSGLSGSGFGRTSVGGQSFGGLKKG